MIRELHILIAILLFLSIEGSSQNRDKDEKLRAVITEYGQAEITVNYTDRDQTDFLSRHLSVYSLKNKQLFITLTLWDIDWFLKQDIEYQIIEYKEDKGLLTASDLNQAMEWNTYPTYTQYDSIMRHFANQYPSLCRLDTIGLSINGKLVLAVKISDNVAEDENEPEVFYTSTMHGDETGGFVLMLRFIDCLLKNYNTDPRVTDLVNELEIWINPLANPDGTYGTGNAISNPVRVNASGSDLNRSFPDPGNPSLVVPKENLDMINFMRKHNFVISANFHGGAEVVNYPWDRWLYKYHADDTWFNSISRTYADTVHNYSASGYMDFMDNGVVRGAEWYSIPGGRQDFVTYELQGREVTIELDDNKETPAAQLGLLWLYNKSSLIGFLENAKYGIHGLVRDSATYNPLRARVFISGHDKDNSNVYSDTLYGAFTRLIAPGSYSLTFSADGYKDKTISFVSVFSGQKTELLVDMQPVLNDINPSPDLPLIYPNPANGRLNVMLPEGIYGDINIKISGLSGKTVRDFDEFNQEGYPLIIDVSSLSAGYYIIVFTNNISGSGCRGKFILVK